jgi:hypothetical protein
VTLCLLECQPHPHDVYLAYCISEGVRGPREVSGADRKLDGGRMFGQPMGNTSKKAYSVEFWIAKLRIYEIIISYILITTNSQFCLLTYKNKCLPECWNTPRTDFSLNQSHLCHFLPVGWVMKSFNSSWSDSYFETLGWYSIIVMTAVETGPHIKWESSCHWTFSLLWNFTFILLYIHSSVLYRGHDKLNALNNTLFTVHCFTEVYWVLKMWQKGNVLGLIIKRIKGSL